MAFAWTLKLATASALMLMLHGVALAQTNGAEAEAQVAAASDPAASDAGAGEPGALSPDDMEILVARIALYPDELVAVISAASLYPLQIVEAARFLDEYAKDSSLQPKETWDGSVISLLNYPDIVKMMSDDLEWTQNLGNAIAYQQQDVLMAIQQLRDQAVADGVIESDDKISVVQEGDNIVIQPTNTETVYVPQYEPQMLYDPGYPPAPIAYYPNPYPSYYYPTATFFAGFVTGAFWGAVVDWDDGGVWGGRWNGGDVDIDIGCNNCFNNREFNGNMNWNDVDWKNVDRDKISIDKNQFKNIDKSNVRNSVKTNLESNQNNNIRNKATNIKKDRPTTLPGRTGGNVKDVRASTLEGLKKGPQARPDRPRPEARPAARPDRPQAASRPGGKPTKISHPAGKPKMAAKPNKQTKKPSALGKPQKKKVSQSHSNRGHKAGPKKVQKRGGRSGGGHKGRRR